ncbi:MAG: xanthine dehydrogenase family protein subunit M [Desulfobacteraceae bacterium]|jgi:carbon-monoxide dehydrogenase medium subunit
MKKFDYYLPKNLEEAFVLMEKQKGHARYVAGGTDLIVRMKQRAIQPDTLISLRNIPQLQGIHWNGGLRLGSTTLFRDIERDEEIARSCTALSQAVRVLANPQVRNVATIGGNLANAAPSADCAPPLLVLGATLTLKGPGGSRDVPAETFFKGPGQSCMDGTEVLTSIHVPRPGKNTGTAFFKAGRVHQDIALINAAALVAMEGKTCTVCRLAAGAVAPVPLRLTKTEKALEGREVTTELLEEVMGLVEEEVSPITDVRSTDWYRRTMSGVLVKRAILQALENVS